MTVMNLGMGASPTSWTPERQTSQTLTTPDEWKAQAAALQKQYATQAGALSSQAQAIGPGKDDLMNSYLWGQAGAFAGAPQGAGASQSALYDNFSGLYSPTAMSGSGYDAVQASGGFNPHFDGFSQQFQSAWDAAPDGSTLGQIHDLEGAAGDASARAAAAVQQAKDRAAQYAQQQATNQNAYGQQLGGGFVGGILPKAPTPQSNWTPDLANVKGAPGVAAPTWGGWAGLSLPPAAMAGFGGAPGGLGGLGGQPQPSQSLGGPFAQRNPWSLA